MCLIKPRREGETDTRLAPKAKQPLEWMLQVLRTYFFSKLNRVILLLKIPWHDEKESRLLQPNFPIFFVSYQHFNLKFSGHIWETCELASSSYTMQILELDEITHPSLVSFPVNYTSYSFRDLWRENKYIARKKLVLASIQMDIEYLTFEARLLSFLHSF